MAKKRTKWDKLAEELVMCKQGGARIRKPPEQCEECPDGDECKEYEDFLEKRAAEPDDARDSEAPEGEDMLPSLAFHHGGDKDTGDGDNKAATVPDDEGDVNSTEAADEDDHDEAANSKAESGEDVPPEMTQASDDQNWTFVRTEEIGLDTIKCDPDEMTRPVHAGHVASLVESAEHFDIEVIVDEDLNLVSGRHRFEAARELGWKVITAQVYRYATDSDRLRHAINENISHGLPYNQDEKRELGLRLFETGTNLADIAECLAVTVRSVQKWTKPKRDTMRSVVASQAKELSQSGATQEEIAAELNVSRNVVRTILGENGENGTCSEITIGDTVEKPERPDADDEPADDADASVVEFDIGELDFSDVSDDASEADAAEPEDEQIYPTRDSDDSYVDDQDADDNDDDDDDNDLGSQVIAQVADAANALTLAAELLQDVDDNQLPSAPELKAVYHKLTDALAAFGKAWKEKITANR